MLLSQFQQTIYSELSGVYEKAKSHKVHGWEGLGDLLLTLDSALIKANKIQERADLQKYVYVFKVSDHLAGHALLSAPVDTPVGLDQVLPNYVLGLFRTLIQQEEFDEELVQDANDHTWSNGASVAISMADIVELLQIQPDERRKTDYFLPSQNNPVLLNVPFFVVSPPDSSDETVAYITKNKQAHTKPLIAIGGYMDTFLDTGNMDEMRNSYDGENFAYMVLDNVYTACSKLVSEDQQCSFQQARESMLEHASSEPGADHGLFCFPITFNDAMDFTRMEFLAHAQNSGQFNRARQIRKLFSYLGYLGLDIDVEKTCEISPDVKNTW